MKTVYMIFIFMTFSNYLFANQPISTAKVGYHNGWQTVEWTSEGYIYPESELEVDNSQDSIILTATGDKYITRISGTLQFDIDFDKTATPDTPVLAPSVNMTSNQDPNLWTGKAKQVVLPHHKSLIKELSIVLADEASIEADSIVTLSHQSLEINEGEKQQLIAAYTYEGVPQYGIVWSIDNEEVATIDNTGWLAAVKEGTAIVTAVTTDGRNLSASCEIIVKKSFIQGDVNNDGKIAVNDIVLTINAILGQTPEGFNASAADMNSDGKIQVNDVVMMVNVVLGISSSPANVRQSLNFIESLTKESFIE